MINTGYDQTLIGTLNAYDDDGVSIGGDVSISLPPYGRRQIVIGAEMIHADRIGYMVLDITSGTAGGYIKFRIEGRYRVAVPAASSVNRGDILIPHIASDDQWWTGVSLLNTTATAKTLSIEFNNGIVHNETLAAHQHKALTIRQVFGNAAPPENTESATIRNGNGVVGLAMFGTRESSPNHYLSGILLKDETASRLCYPHVAQDDVWWTGIVAYNPSPAESRITLTPYRKDGIALTTRTLSIPAYGKYIGTAAELAFPEGTAWFVIHATDPVTGFELFGIHDGQQHARSGKPLRFGGLAVIRRVGSADDLFEISTAWSNLHAGADSRRIT